MFHFCLASQQIRIKPKAIQTSCVNFNEVTLSMRLNKHQSQHDQPFVSRQCKPSFFSFFGSFSHRMDKKVKLTALPSFSGTDRRLALGLVPQGLSLSRVFNGRDIQNVLLTSKISPTQGGKCSWNLKKMSFLFSNSSDMSEQGHKNISF